MAMEYKHHQSKQVRQLMGEERAGSLTVDTGQPLDARKSLSSGI